MYPFMDWEPVKVSSPDKVLKVMKKADEALPWCQTFSTDSHGQVTAVGLHTVYVTLQLQVYLNMTSHLIMHRNVGLYQTVG